MNKSLQNSLSLAKSSLKIIKIIMFAGFVLTCLLAALMLFTNLSDSMISSESISFGALKFTLVAGSVIKIQSFKFLVVIALVFSAALLFVITKGVKLIEEMVDSALDSSPFTAVVSTNLKKISQLIICGGVISNIMKAAIAYRTYSAVDFTQFINTQIVKNIEWSYTFSAGFLIVAALVYLLSMIFEYGNELQTLSDETL